MLEFDLGRFLDFAGNPDAVSKAELILDTPTMAAPPPLPVDVGNITAFGGKFYFTGSAAEGGYALWVTDGTPAGTGLLVNEMMRGRGSLSLSSLVSANGALYFTAGQGGGNIELWKVSLDGDTASASKVADMKSGGGPIELTAVGNTLYFAAYEDVSNSIKLWCYDGGVAPKLIPAQTGFVNPSELRAVDGKLLFTAQPDSISTDRDVWQYDGATFTRLSDVPGNNSSPAEMTLFNGNIVFAAEDAPAGRTMESDKKGRELWWNLEEGTKLLANIGQPDTDPVTFSYYDPILGRTITRTTPGNVVSSSPAELTVAGDALYFTANDGANGRELWKTDGTQAGKIMVTNLSPGLKEHALRGNRGGSYR